MKKSGVLKHIISDIFNTLKRVRCEEEINCCNPLVSLIWLLGYSYYRKGLMKENRRILIAHEILRLLLYWSNHKTTFYNCSPGTIITTALENRPKSVYIALLILVDKKMNVIFRISAKTALSSISSKEKNCFLKNSPEGTIDELSRRKALRGTTGQFSEEKLFFEKYIF